MYLWEKILTWISLDTRIKFSLTLLFVTPHTQCEQGEVIGVGVYESAVAFSM